MDRIRTLRRSVRGNITRIVNESQQELELEAPDPIELQSRVNRLEGLVEKVNQLDQDMATEMLDAGCSEEDFDEENEAVQDYLLKAEKVKLRIQKFLQPIVRPPSPPLSTYSTATGAEFEKKRTFRLPKIELKRFDGELKEWIGWWAQFSKIDEDDQLHATDKFQYLIQATVEGSKARRVVEGYPQSEENYPKAVAALKDRFGDQSLLTEIYVRQLLTRVKSQDSIELGKLYDELESQLRALETLGINTKTSAVFLYPMVESCLPMDILQVWQRSSLAGYNGPDVKPTQERLESLMEFLKTEVKGAQRLAIVKNTREPVKRVKDGKYSQNFRTKRVTESEGSTAASLYSTSKEACVFCERSNHQSTECYSAKRMSLEERKKKIQDSRACYNCLKSGHSVNKCKSKYVCFVCQRKHHTLICPGKEAFQKEDLEQVVDGVKTMTVVQPSVLTSTKVANNVVLMKTLLVRVKGTDHKERQVRLLFDDGSQKSYIKTSLAKELHCEKLNEIKIQNCLFGGKVTEMKSRFQLKVNLRGAGGHYKQARREAIMVNEDVISGACPKVPRGPWIQELAEKRIFITDMGASSSEVEILIGSDLWGSFMTGRMIQLRCGLTAVESIFGWTLSGKINSVSKNSVACSVITMLTQEERSLTDMWSLETIGIKDSAEKISQEEHEIEMKTAFHQNITREENGRYVVRLPWINQSIQLPSNKFVAEKRLVSTTKKLKEQNEFQNYENIFRSWEKEGIIEEVSGESEKEHFLPHRPVFKPDSLTTPVRPVFDASCRVGKAPSLNDCLEKGPNLLEVIPSILLRFREKRIGVISDVRKAFQMISVHNDDRNFQKFLWWESPEVLKQYRHCRVVFGVNCSPFILAAVIEWHLRNVDPRHQPTAEVLRKSLYVDNSVVSFDEVEDYRKFREEATHLMEQAKMELRQWESNSEVEGHPVTCVLGLNWDKGEDQLFCQLPKKRNLIDEMKITKRSVLSLVSQIFDPLGILCPAVIQPKMLIQESWADSLDWDKEWDQEHTRKFRKWCTEIPVIEKIRIPRYVFRGEIENRQLHCFADASKSAYAACIFVRTEWGDAVDVQLVTAKSRLAPLDKKKSKKVTIPRLELLGCMVGVRLTQTVLEAIGPLPITYWSDSTTALAWIRREEDWGTFVGNRVKEIRQHTNGNQWKHVPGEINPADLPSRGCTPSQLLESRWWEGPKWLRESREKWPSREELPEEDEICIERKKTMVNLSVELPEPRYSSFSKNVRVAAYIRRLIGNLRRKVNKQMTIQSPYLTFDELRTGELDIVREIQNRNYKEVPKFSTICVRRSGDGLLRVETRMTYRDDWEAFISPVLLPSDDPLVEQLIREIHETNCHAGTQFVLNKIREKYWIVQGRKTVGRVIRKCVTCRRYSTKELTGEPAPLPKNRIETRYAFETTGVDLAGPVMLKGGKKAWIVLYTCAVYRGVYLDWVDSLSTEEFLDSLEKFANLVGRPNTMYSDNGTNFVGAENLMKKLDWGKLESKLQVKKIKWIFNPPSAPWWGGWWERLVRTVKDLLRKMLGPAKLEAKGLGKCLAAVSCVINERPLTTLTEDPEDLTPLTPAMFMRDLPVGGLPERKLVTQKDLQESYRKIRELKEALKARFRKEYLAQLVQKKNEKNLPPPRIGDVVLVGADNKKRCEWPLAKIIELIPGKDEKVRVAKVRTTGGILNRPLQRLYPLEVASAEDIPVSTQVKEQIVAPKKSQDEREELEEPVITCKGRISRKPIRYSSWNY